MWDSIAPELPGSLVFSKTTSAQEKKIGWKLVGLGANSGSEGCPGWKLKFMHLFLC